jgi:hypothetical protein
MAARNEPLAHNTAEIIGIAKFETVPRADKARNVKCNILFQHKGKP